jgi:hypothetical protein
MGIFSPFSRHYSDERDSGPNCEEPKNHRKSPERKKPTRNPDPRNFEILETKRVRNFVIARIKYPNCSNYEGEKILVFKNITVKYLRSQRIIDPHFTDKPSELPLFARFQPTQTGWNSAIKMCKII